MKSRTWIFAGLGLSIAAYIAFRRGAGHCALATDGLEAAGDRAASWGRKQRATGGLKFVDGKLKKGIGRVIGSRSLVSEGLVDQAAGAAQHTAGKVASSVGEAIHGLNR